MSLGLESGTVRVVDYDPAWPDLFELESKRLRNKFQVRGLDAVIEHTGSTAVPGLPAKPILDILIGYPRSADVQPYIHALTEAEYVHRQQQDLPEHEFLRRGDPRAYHIHLTPVDSYFWRDHLTFRDRLRANDELRDAYAVLKRKLAAQFPADREAYIAGKGAFVKQVIDSQ